MESRVYFENIKSRIREELEKSSSSVYLAVAWLTDDQLFFDLVKLSSKGIGVKIILNDDRINRTSGLDLSELYQNGGLVYFVNSSENLMHNKFCIIDEKIIINGSFNWTRKANENLENISIIKDEKASEEFLKQFNKLMSNTFQSAEYLNLGNTEKLNLQLENNLTYSELVNRAEKRKKNESFLMAVYDYKKALKISDKNKQILFDLAYCQSEIGNNKAAIENYSSYLGYFPESAPALNNRGNVYEQLKQLDKAIEDYNSAISVEDDLIYYRNRARTYASFLPDDGTIYSVYKNLSIDRFTLSVLDFKKKQGRNAIQDYLNISKKFKDVDPSEYYEDIADIYYKIRDFEMSIKYYSLAIANSKDNDYTYYSRGWCYFEVNSLEKAFSDVKEALTCSPNNISYKELLTLIKKEKRKLKNWFK